VFSKRIMLRNPEDIPEQDMGNMGSKTMITTIICRFINFPKRAGKLSHRIKMVCNFLIQLLVVTIPAQQLHPEIIADKSIGFVYFREGLLIIPLRAEINPEFFPERRVTFRRCHIEIKSIILACFRPIPRTHQLAVFALRLVAEILSII